MIDIDGLSNSFNHQPDNHFLKRHMCAIFRMKPSNFGDDVDDVVGMSPLRDATAELSSLHNRSTRML